MNANAIVRPEHLLSAQGRLAGKVALITGAAQGMGAAHARALAREGARVAIADIATEAGKRLAAELRDRGRGGTYHDHDVTDPSAWRELVAAVDAAPRPDRRARQQRSGSSSARSASRPATTSGPRWSRSTSAACSSACAP